MISSSSFSEPETAIAAPGFLTRVAAALFAVGVAIGWYLGLLYLLLRGARLILGLFF